MPSPTSDPIRSTSSNSCPGSRLRDWLLSSATSWGIRREEPSDDAVAVLVQLTEGAIGALLISQISAGHGQGLTLELSGNLAGLMLDQEDPTGLWEGLAGTGKRRRIDLTATDLSGDAKALGFTPQGTIGDYLNAFTAFVRDSYAAMSSGVDVDGLPTIADGIRAVHIGEAVRRSATTHDWIELTAPDTTRTAQVAG